MMSSAHPSIRLVVEVIAATGIFPASAAAAPPARVVIDAKAVFPVSIDASRRGDLFVGSTRTGGIYRARHGADLATLWIDPQVSGMKGVLGIHVDDRHRTLYACAQVLGAKAGTDASSSAGMVPRPPSWSWRCPVRSNVLTGCG